jgi:hypothetical protein
LYYIVQCGYWRLALPNGRDRQRQVPFEFEGTKLLAGRPKIGRVKLTQAGQYGTDESSGS